MSALFDDLKEGLLEAIDYEKGSGVALVTTSPISPVRMNDVLDSDAENKVPFVKVTSA